MKTQILGMLAETFIHPGTGQSVGAIDLPVAREAATSYPFIAGSSLKGAIRDTFENHKGKEEAENIFGKQDNAGGVMVSDARLLLLPVRSLSSSYKWLTCPHLLERFSRDMKRGNQETSLSLTIDRKKVLTKGSGKLFLEERSFEFAEKVPENILEAIKPLFGASPAANRLADQLAIIHDDDFSYFARYGLAIQARNVLNEKKTSDNLWYEETIPPDTLMYSVLVERNDGTLSKIKEAISDYLQVGGNETVGQGWFALSWQGGTA
jgi:CRISPR-associated protein Cmr4